MLFCTVRQSTRCRPQSIRKIFCLQSQRNEARSGEIDKLFVSAFFFFCLFHLQPEREGRKEKGPVYTKTMWKRNGKFADSIRYDRLRTKRYSRVYTKTMQGRSKTPSFGPTTKSSFFCCASTITKGQHAWTGTLCAWNTSWFDKCFQMYRRTCISLLLILFFFIRNISQKENEKKIDT